LPPARVSTLGVALATESEAGKSDDEAADEVAELGGKSLSMIDLFSRMLLRSVLRKPLSKAYAVLLAFSSHDARQSAFFQNRKKRAPIEIFT